MTLQVGQTLWYVPNSSWGKPREVTITKIGRKWATTDHHFRVDLQTLVVDSGLSSPGRCYLSAEAHERSQRADDLWLAFFRGVRAYRRPQGVSEWGIREAARLLHIELPPQPEGQ